MEEIRFKITGVAPMLMHSDRFANPLDPATKAHKELTSKRKKTDEDIAAIAESEWKGSLYWSKEIGIFMPTMNVRKSLIEGARLNKLGKHIERAVIFLSEAAKLIYSGPQDKNELWNDERFVDARSVVVSRSRLIRYRPVFREWSFHVDIVFDENIINLSDVVMCFQNAGRVVGLGDFRPMFGRYSVEVV